MAIKHTMVSYYGLNYVEHAEADLARAGRSVLIATNSTS